MDLFGILYKTAIRNDKTRRGLSGLWRLWVAAVQSVPIVFDLSDRLLSEVTVYGGNAAGFSFRAP